MSNMAEVNGSDHLVRPEKEGKLNGYDNEGYHCKERSEDEEESASDDDRLRAVVTENGHRSEDSHLSNGHVHEELNGHSTAVNGCAVIVVEDDKTDSKMNDNKDENSQKPLDTRLHHYVPVDDIDRKILNGSDGTRVTIPEDAVINFTTGRVKVKKGTSNNTAVSNERESIPLETMLPSYEGEDKVGLGEKAELEAELANHKNGLWSEGHNAYNNPEGPFGNSEKLNGTSKSSDEVSLPVNNHRKCLSSDESDTISEPKSTGEKLYFTEENRKLCPGWRRLFVCGLILIILSVALLLGVLAATGILLAESESKNTRYESGHSLPSIDSISHAGHSFRPRAPSKVPQKFLPSTTGDAPLPPSNSTVSGTGDSVSRTPPTVSSKVPVLNDSSHSQTIVPNALVGEFIIDENFTEDLKDSNSDGYGSLANYIERELWGIFKRSGGVFEELKILSFSPGSIKVKFVCIWASDQNVILSQKAKEIMQSYLRKNHNSLLAYPVDLNSIHFKDVFNECRVQKGGCSFECSWDYDTLSKTCTCEEDEVLLADEKSCGPKPSTSNVATTPKLFTRFPTTSTKAPLLTEESTKSTAVQLDYPSITTTISTLVTETMTTVSDLLKIMTTTESSDLTHKDNSSDQNFPIINESTSLNLETTTVQTISEEPTTVLKDKFTTENLETIQNTSTEVPTVTNEFTTESHNILIHFNDTEIFSTVSDVSSLETTNSGLDHETTTQKSTISSTEDSKYIESLNRSITTVLTTEPFTTQAESVSTIGYHVKNITTEIYTLKEGTDFETTTLSFTKSDITTNGPPVTVTETEVPVTGAETAPEVVNVFASTTEIITSSMIPTTEASTNSVKLDTTSLDTTDVSKANISTENSSIPVTETDSVQHITTEKVITTIKEENEYTTVHGNVFEVNGTTLTLPKFLVNETDEFQETTTAFISETTTINITSANTHFNRTPEVRSYDEDLENSTFTANDSSSTQNPILSTSTEVNMFAINSTVTESEVEEALPTTNLGTTTLSSQDYVSSATSMVLDSEESNANHTTVNYNLTNENKQVTSTPNSIPSTETEFESTDVMLDSETLKNTESTPESSTYNSNNFDHVEFNNTSDSNMPFNESDITVLDAAETESVNNTYSMTEFPEATINNSFTVHNLTDLDSTITPFESNISTGFVTSDSLSDTATSFNTETAITDLGTAPNLEISSNLTVFTEMLNSSTDQGTTDRSLITTLSESASSVNDLTTVESIIVTTTISDTLNDSESTTSASEDNRNETTNSPNFTFSNDSEDILTSTTTEDFTFPTPPTYFNESEDYNMTESVSDTEMFSTLGYSNDTLLPVDLGNASFIPFMNMTGEGFDEMDTSSLLGVNETMENSTLIEDFGNFTTINYEDVTNETTTNATTGVECREDQFLCEPLNLCINDTFLCDGIADCPDSSDEFECKDTCHSNFMCANSSTCIMSDVRCDGIWDCENGSDEDNCTPNECAKHEVMCLDGSKCIKPGHICDWKYNCLDRSDEVGCVERTTCESGGRFFCNDGLCIPWSLKCDGEHDCKDGEDEGNCTCLNDEFQCNDGKCLKSSSRCDGHQDCHDADDEMGCVTVDSQHIVSTYEPYSGTWALLCAEDWTPDDGQNLCRELGFGHALSIEKVHVSFNGTWMAMRRENLTDSSLWTERVSFVESCTSSLAAAVECQTFQCGEYSGLLHRRRRDVVSSSSSQWPFIGYTSTFHSKKGCLSEILTPIWLITSAECLLSISKEPFNGSDWYVRTKIGQNIEADMAQNHEVLRIINHPHSSKFRSLTLRDYDVALIRLKHALVFVSDKIGAICPPDEQVPPGITCFSSVLGTEKPRAPPPQSLTINFLALQITEKGNCNGVEHYNGAVNQRMLCTQSSEGHTICDNDEGTPLMCLSGINKWFLAGMLTYQRFCDVYSKHPAVFSNLFSMKKFLDQVTGQKQYEIPYDNSVYIIIPPTTPSPTLPETTTSAMTTIVTTELSLFDENMTETTMFDNFGEINGTTSVNEELFRVEHKTAMPTTISFNFDNSTEQETFENETIPGFYGMDLDTINSTVQDELTANKTHSYLMTLLNNTSSEDGFNSTSLSTLDDNREFSNLTSSDFLPTAPTLLDLTTIPTSLEINTTVSDDEKFTTIIVTTKNEPSLFIEESRDEFMPIIHSINETPTNISISPMNGFREEVENFSGSLNDTGTTDLPYMSIFNESLEMFKPMIALTNESLAMSQPLVGLMNDTSEMEIESPTISSTLNPLDYTQERNTSKANLYEIDFNTSKGTLEDIAEIPTTETSTTVRVSTELKTISTSVPDSTTEITVREESKIETTDSIIADLTTRKPIKYRAEFETNAYIMADSTTEIPKEAKAELETASTLMNTATKIPVEGKVELETSSTPITLAKIPLESKDVDTNNSTTMDTNINTSLETNTEFGTKGSLMIDSTTKTFSGARDELIKTTLPAIDTTTDISVKERAQASTSTVSEPYSTSEVPTETIAEFKSTESPLTTSSERIELATTAVPVTDGTESFVLELEGEPDSDLAFYVFNSSDGMKFESYSLPENNTLNNASKPIISEKEYPVADVTTDSTPYSETVSSSSMLPNNSLDSFESAANISRYFDFILDNKTTDTNTETDLLSTDFTAPENLEITTTSGTEINTALSTTENFENVTSIMSDIGNDDARIETLKTHLISEELTVLQDGSSVNFSDCGSWSANAGKINYYDNDNFFMQWPALGFLQMISESKMCASTVVSHKYVLTSFNCLSFRDNQLDPDNWIYTGGYTDAINGTQNLLVSQIIPYPDQNASLLFNDHDLALVEVKDSIRMDEYSKIACIGKDVFNTRDCYTTGWNKNASGDEFQQDFQSIPLSVISPEECNNTQNYNGMLLDTLICGINEDESVSLCKLDLGSPLFCLNDNSKWEIQGILNFPGSCRKPQPSVFKSIASVRKWIIDIISDEKSL